MFLFSGDYCSEAVDPSLYSSLFVLCSRQSRYSPRLNDRHGLFQYTINTQLLLMQSQLAFRLVFMQYPP
jgi:hypothetical protein